jgi:hypothetical protein
MMHLKFKKYHEEDGEWISDLGYIEESTITNSLYVEGNRYNGGYC